MHRPLLLLSATDPDAGVRATATLVSRNDAASGITSLSVEAATETVVRAEDVLDLLAALGLPMPTLPTAVVPERRPVAETAQGPTGKGGWNRKRPSDEELARAFHECGRSGSELARRYGVCAQSANQWIRDAGLRLPPATRRAIGR